MSLGLPPVSSGLKSIAPYLQRAEELVDREPVVAYWCAYYAAQLGISLKAQDSSSRTLLLNLLDALERLKKEIGPNDAIDIEPASAAYVENFAFNVFNMADDDDRAGRASKSTARRFLAAANFFQVLRVFPKVDVSESTENKLKYAKWKAADIAKALREGRRPTPGPAASQLDPVLSSPPPPSDQFPSEQPPLTPPRSHPPEPSPPTDSSPRSGRRQSPPPPIPHVDIARANRLPILPGQGKHDDEALSPGCWSTTATPGFDLAKSPALDGLGSASASSDSLNNWHEHVVDPLTRTAARANGSKLRTGWVSTEMDGAASDENPVEDTLLNADRSRGRMPFSPFAPTFPVEASPSHHASHTPSSASPPFCAQDPSSSPPRVSDLPPGFVPTLSPSYVPGSGSATFAGGPSFVVPPPPVPHSAPTFTVPPSPPASIVTPVSATTSPPAIERIRVTARTVELTPTIISKAQKHCRFAISALDYEDAQHAIKELKAALEILGG